MNEVEKLIEKIQEVKAQQPKLEISEVLKIFEIKALRDLTIQMRRVINGR